MHNLREGLLARLRGVATKGAPEVWRDCDLPTLRRVCLAGTSSDFAVLLGDTVQSRTLDFYRLASAELAVNLLTRRADLKDFKPSRTVKIDAPPMAQIGPGGEVVEKLIGVDGEVLQLLRFALISAYSFESVANDDTSALDAIAEFFGLSAASAENSHFLRILLANGATADGNAFFSTAHANLAGTPGALDSTKLAASIALLRAQSSPSGAPLNLRPFALLVGPAQERVAQQLVREQTVPGSPTLRVVVDAAVTDNRHYIFADPSLRPGFHRGRLLGRPDGPEVIQQQRTFESDGWRFKGSNNFCIGLGDPRAVVLTLGA
jgi:hypothetical protein